MPFLFLPAHLRCICICRPDLLFPFLQTNPLYLFVRHSVLTHALFSLIRNVLPMLSPFFSCLDNISRKNPYPETKSKGLLPSGLTAVRLLFLLTEGLLFLSLDCRFYPGRDFFSDVSRHGRWMCCSPLFYSHLSARKTAAFSDSMPLLQHPDWPPHPCGQTPF